MGWQVRVSFDGFETTGLMVLAARPLITYEVFEYNPTAPLRGTSIEDGECTTNILADLLGGASPRLHPRPPGPRPVAGLGDLRRDDFATVVHTFEAEEQ